MESIIAPGTSSCPACDGPGGLKVRGKGRNPPIYACSDCNVEFTRDGFA